MDIGGAAVVGGHVAASVARPRRPACVAPVSSASVAPVSSASVARNTASTHLVFSVAFLIGFRPDTESLDWLAAAGILLSFIGAISWLSAAVGLLATTPEAASGFTSS
jgi:ABC-2 type transport system permease protein